jgi:acyl carrier protein
MRIESELRSIISAVTGVSSDFDADAHLYWEIGVTSAKALELMLELEDRYGVRIPDAQFVQATSLRHLAQLMSGLVCGSGGAGREPERV